MRMEKPCTTQAQHVSFLSSPNTWEILPKNFHFSQTSFPTAQVSPSHKEMPRPQETPPRTVWPSLDTLYEHAIFFFQSSLCRPFHQWEHNGKTYRWDHIHSPQQILCSLPFIFDNASAISDGHFTHLAAILFPKIIIESFTLEKTLEIIESNH